MMGEVFGRASGLSYHPNEVIKMNMQKMLQQAKQMQKELQEKQEEFENESFTGQAGGGAVSVTLKGDGSVESVDIEEDVLDNDTDLVEDLVLSAFSAARDTLEDAKEEKLGDIDGMGGMGDMMGQLGDML